jgi:hypothetical protein
LVKTKVFLRSVIDYVKMNHIFPSPLNDAACAKKLNLAKNKVAKSRCLSFVVFCPIMSLGRHNVMFTVQGNRMVKDTGKLPIRKSNAFIGTAVDF